MPDRLNFQTLDLSRRRFLRGAALLGGAAAALAAHPAAADTKMSQKAARYQPTPKGPQQCDNCSQYAPPTSCNIVDGRVSSAGWCQLYAHK
jgi:hypothetical protein